MLEDRPRQPIGDANGLSDAAVGHLSLAADCQLTVIRDSVAADAKNLCRSAEHELVNRAWRANVRLSRIVEALFE
jgi:hypothetical protein